MNDFDLRAREWDKDQIHIDRANSIATELEKMIPLSVSMKALEYGAGTGLLSFALKDKFKEITLMDNSQEMINVCIEKTQYYKTKHINPVLFNLEISDYNIAFDIIYNQMVLHHVKEVNLILTKFYNLLNENGYLAIADLFPEDGSFHGQEIQVHKGFDPKALSETLKEIGFRHTKYSTCFVMRRISDKPYPVFLLIAQK